MKGGIFMRRMVDFISLAVMGFALWGASVAGAQTEVKFIKIGTASPGGLWYLAGAKLATEIHKAIPPIETSSTTGGSVANATAVNKGTEIQLAFNNAAIQSLAFQGKTPFKAAHPDIRMIGTMETMLWHMVVLRSSSIKSVYDLKDKRINLGRVGSLDRQAAIAVLRNYGITPESIEANKGTVHALSFNDAADMMRDGHLDVIMTPGAIMPYLVDLDTRPGLRWLPLGGKEREKVLADPEMKGWAPGVLKKGLFAGITEDVPTIQVKTTIIVNKNLPDDLVYRLTKIVYESGFQKEVFASGEAKGLPRACNLADAKEAATIPIHPGAMRYFKERGVLF
jgi:TRAP transporter TAXI family solute receptor